LARPRQHWRRRRPAVGQVEHREIRRQGHVPCLDLSSAFRIPDEHVVHAAHKAPREVSDRAAQRAEGLWKVHARNVEPGRQEQ
jgi:hypothetical protein